MQKPENSDENLIKKYLKGDKNSLDVLVKRYFRQIYFFVLKYAGTPQDSEDITQEVFLKVWKHIKRFDQKKSFRAWIFTIAKNTALDFLKKKKEIPFSKFEDSEGRNFLTETLAGNLISPAEWAEKKDTFRELNFAVKKFSLKCQKIFSLRYDKQWTFQEIADEMGEPLSTIKSRHRRATQSIKKMIEGGR
jgi:RNA polymerase sigma factor (sigma-70 family)